MTYGLALLDIVLHLWMCDSRRLLLLCNGSGTSYLQVRKNLVTCCRERVAGEVLQAKCCFVDLLFRLTCLSCNSGLAQCLPGCCKPRCVPLCTQAHSLRVTFNFAEVTDPPLGPGSRSIPSRPLQPLAGRRL